MAILAYFYTILHLVPAIQGINLAEIVHVKKTKSVSTFPASFFLLLPALSCFADCPPAAVEQGNPPQLPMEVLDASCRIFIRLGGGQRHRQDPTRALGRHDPKKALFLSLWNSVRSVPLDPNQNENYGKKFFISESSSYFGKSNMHGGLYGAPDPIMTLDFSGNLDCYFESACPPAPSSSIRTSSQLTPLLSGVICGHSVPRKPANKRRKSSLIKMVIRQIGHPITSS